MTKTLDAVYESGGVLKLREPLDLAENTHVRIILQTSPEPALTGPSGTRRMPPGAGAFDSGYTDTADRADEILGELRFGEPRA